MTLTLLVGNRDERHPGLDAESAIRVLRTVDIEDFIVIEPTESTSTTSFFQAFRDNDADFQCEYFDGRTLFRSEPATAPRALVESCLAAYYIHGPASDEFQTATRWVPHENQPELVPEVSSNAANCESDPPQMTGLEFEKFVARSLQDAGWSTRLTRRTGDQGLDLFAFDDEFRVAIQCKRYTDPVSNNAVQEVHAAADVLQATHAVVVTTSRYTSSASSLAATLGVILLTTEQLHELRSHLIFVRPRHVGRVGPKLFLDT